MNAEIKAKWVKALRSGRYKQGEKALLHRGEGGNHYCCLGVLCRVVGAKPIDENSQGQVRFSGGHKFAQIEDPYSWPPYTVTQRAGVPNEECATLARMNDGGSSFDSIAKYIEERL